ncbi:tetratricopeptide repeat protein [Myroides odoratus]|uniref:tetratricopeptide repeat protein n=1 Tax=Myroides odoratus TaxID=256 RepID=UPI003341879C
MKKYEKRLLQIIAILFSIYLLFPIAHITSTPFFLTIWILAISYFIRSYWIFNTQETKQTYLPISAGVLFALALITLPSAIQLQASEIYVYLPIPTILLTIGLGIYLFLYRKTDKIKVDIKSIFYRGLVLSVICSFFLYTPETFRPYRKILIQLNKGDEFLTNNLLMMDYTYESETAIDQDDCDTAIALALKANRHARELIKKTEMEEQNYQTREIIFNELNQDRTVNLSIEAIELIEKYEGEIHLAPISRTYSTLYSAYVCKADNLYNQLDLKVALANYLTAYKYLTTPEIRLQYWKEEKSKTLNMIANCYKGLNKIELAAAFYLQAIDNYHKITDQEAIDLTVATYYNNLAVLFSSQYEYETSTTIYEKIITDLLKEKQTTIHREIILKSYHAQTINYLAQDNLKLALQTLEKARNIVNKTDSNYCIFRSIEALCQFRMNQFEVAVVTLNECVHCFENTNPIQTFKLIESSILLGQIELALGQLKKAEKTLSTSLKLTAQTLGENTDIYAYNLKVIGDLNKLLGNYRTADAQYQKVLDIYNKNQGILVHNVPLTLISLSDLELIRGNLSKAQLHIQEASHMTLGTKQPTTLSHTNVLNQTAYVAYHQGRLTEADTLYKKVIQLTTKLDVTPSTIRAFALNGLGLIEMDRKNYALSDAMFSESLLFYQQIYSDKSPFTAQVYLNYGILNTREGKLAEAKGKLDRSLKINQQFFKTDHPVFGDIAVAFGDLAIKKGERDLAQQQYQKALAIYNKYFDSTHWKVRETQQKLK